MQQETVRLSKQGDPSAIAALINQSLRPKGIVAKVVRKNDCLRILLDASPPPDQVASVRFVESGITKLEIPGITTLQILGRQMGQSLPAWNQIILLGDESEANPFHEEHPLVVAIQEAKPNFTIPNYTPPGNKAFGVVFGIFGLIGGIVFLAIPIIGWVLGIMAIIGSFGMIAGSISGDGMLNGECPYCGTKASTLESVEGITCKGCKKRILVRDKKFYQV